MGGCCARCLLLRGTSPPLAVISGALSLPEILLCMGMLVFCLLGFLVASCGAVPLAVSAHPCLPACLAYHADLPSCLPACLAVCRSWMTARPSSS
jgi:hypothetical protein